MFLASVLSVPGMWAMGFVSAVYVGIQYVFIAAAGTGSPIGGCHLAAMHADLADSVIAIIAGRWYWGGRRCLAA